MRLKKISVGLCLTILFGVAGYAENSTLFKPNIVFIVITGLRNDYVVAGGPVSITPNIDKFARGAFVFKSAVAASPNSVQSLASLFLSRYPSQIQIQTPTKNKFYQNFRQKKRSERLNPSELTLARYLNQIGYSTFGYSSDRKVGEKQGLDLGFKHYEVMESLNKGTAILKKPWEDYQLSQADKNKMLFVYISDFNSLATNASDRESVKRWPWLGPSGEMSKDALNAIGSNLKNIYPGDDEQAKLDQKKWRLAYAAKLKKFDHLFKELLGALEKASDAGNTMVIITADHGMQLGENGSWGSEYVVQRGMVNVPLIIKLPFQKKGEIIENSVGLIDVLPTLRDYLSLSISAKFLTGTSFLPLLKGENFPEMDVFSEAAVYETAPFRFISVQNNSYKMIWDYPAGWSALYELKIDSPESKNISNDKPDITMKFMQKIHTYATERARELYE